MSEKSEVGGVLKGALARWPIIVVATLVVGAAAFGYALLTFDGPSKEAVSAIRFETVGGVPVQPTVDMGISAAKSADTQASAAETAGVDVADLEINAFADPNDAALVRISVRSDDAETAKTVADALAELSTERVRGVLEPELGQNRALLELAEIRLEDVTARKTRWLELISGTSVTATQQASAEVTLLGIENQEAVTKGSIIVAQFNVDRFLGAVMVEGEAAAVDVSSSAEIVGMTLQGLAIGAIAGVAVAFLLSLAEVRRRS